MSITSLSSSKRSKFPTILLYLITLIGIGLIIYFGDDLIRNIENLRGKSVFSAESLNQQAEVYLNKKSMGNTPYENKNTKSGENKVIFKTADRQYETTIDFLPNTEIYVQRDLGVSDNFSSGQNFWIEKASTQAVLSVTSEPSNASVFIDNSEVGKTPFSSSTLTQGEYDLRVELPGYEKQASRVSIQKGYNLNVAVKLFPIPVSATINPFEGSTSFYDLSTSNTLLSSDTENWAKAVIYWNRTRGVNLAGLGVNKDQVFDYFIDYKGDLYNKEGKVVTTNADYSQFKDAVKGAYLGRISDGAGLTQAAKDIYSKLTQGAGIGGKAAKIKETGTGWLRVRDAAGLNGSEIARVNTGETYPVLEEQSDWLKIKVSDTVQGWVSKSYVDITQ